MPPLPDAPSARRWDEDEEPLPDVDSPWDPEDEPVPSDGDLGEIEPGEPEEEHAGRHDLPPVSTREQRRSRRKREVRARTISMARMSKRELQIGALLYPPDENREQRPATRAECAGGERPCPFVSCKHNLYLDTSKRTGAIKLNFPDLEVWEMPPHGSCALDVADLGGATLEHVGEVMNMTRQRVRQVEVKALAQLAQAEKMKRLNPNEDEREVRQVRRLPVLLDEDAAE